MEHFRKQQFITRTNDDYLFNLLYQEIMDII